MSQPSRIAGHAFISYVREDKIRVDRLQWALEAAGVPVWRDSRDLWPGQDWRLMIRSAISNDALAFIACFSQVSLSKVRSYQNEEFLLAIDQMRLRAPEHTWLIPVRFDDCTIPDRDIGGGRTLPSIQRADLFGDTYAEQLAKLIQMIGHILSRDSSAVATLVPADTRQRTDPPDAILLDVTAREDSTALFDIGRDGGDVQQFYEKD